MGIRGFAAIRVEDLGGRALRRVQRRPSVDTREIVPDLRLDLDEQGRLVGLDVDHASTIPDLKTLESEGLPLQTLTSAHRHADG